MARRKRVRWRLAWPARFVAKWEGFVPEAYLDTIASPPVWTIGYGHTGPIRGADGRLRPIRAGDRVNRAYAMTLLAADLREAARAVRAGVHVPITVRQRIALISFAFNCGTGAFLSSTLLRKLNAGDYRGAANELPKWSHAGGVVVQGLLNRRRAERWLMTHPRKRGRR